MNELYVLPLMIFCHIIDDYKIQAGVLAFLKQKSYWRDNLPKECETKNLDDTIYKHDYIMALFMHAFSWSFMIHVPIMLISSRPIYVIVSLCVNMSIHAIVDDLKANKLKINLVVDQLIHIIQILIVFIIFMIIG